MFKKPTSQHIKEKARKNLSAKFDKSQKNYVVDTSAVINCFISRLIKKGLSGTIIVPNAVMAELENLANRGKEEGFKGLDEIASFHKLKSQYKFKLYFYGNRPSEMQIRFAKTGEIDALIRDIATKNKAILITADLVQAKSAQAYGLGVIFLQPPKIPEKKHLFSFFRKRK